MARRIIMTESFNLQRQLDEMSKEIKKMSEDIIKLTAINEHQFMERQSNSQKLEVLGNEFAQNKGAINLLKGITTLISGGCIAFFTWIVTVNNDQQKEIYLLTQRTVILENQMNTLQEDNLKLIKDIHNANDSTRQD